MMAIYVTCDILCMCTFVKLTSENWTVAVEYALTRMVVFITSVRVVATICDHHHVLKNEITSHVLKNEITSLHISILNLKFNVYVLKRCQNCK